MPELTVHIRRVADVAGTILSPAEADRAARFRFDPARRRYSAARTLLRQLTAERLGIEPAAVPLEADEHGKPFLTGRLFELNLSHSGDYIAVAFAPTPVGIDIEQINDRTPIDAIASRFFRPNEVAYLESLPDIARRAAFFRLWTMKEAAIKADGLGVWRSIATVELDDPAEPHMCHVNGRVWGVRGVEVGGGYCGAVAIGRR